MNALSIVNNVVSLVSYNMHKTRLSAVTACVKSLLNGSAATVTSIARPNSHECSIYCEQCRIACQLQYA